MAAFSTHHHSPFIVSDSVYVPNTASTNMSTSSPSSTATCFSPICPSKYLLQTTFKQVSKSSPMAPELERGDEATQVVTQLEKKRKAMASELEGGGKCKKGKKFDDGMSEIVEENKMRAGRNKDKKKVSEEAPPPPTGYVHVRARRGQATDSHSLAERVRREKISERMKLLQSLVPGCDRITGKALILDEIINYVQSLQNQVEFLVRKLASVYPDFFNYLDAHSPAPALENCCNMKRPLSSGPQSESMELGVGVGAGAGAAPTSTFFSLEPDNTSIFYSLDDEELLGNIDDQIQMLANNFGLDNLHSF